MFSNLPNTTTTVFGQGFIPQIINHANAGGIEGGGTGAVWQIVTELSHVINYNQH